MRGKQVRFVMFLIRVDWNIVSSLAIYFVVFSEFRGP